MTIIDAEKTVVMAKYGWERPAELSVYDKPECPECGASAAMQTTVGREPDGALEIVILVCDECAADHPVWF